MKKQALKTGLTFAFCGFLLYLAIHYWTHIGNLITGIFSAGIPLFIGLIIAYILNIIMCFFERHILTRAKKPWLRKLRRPLCIILAVLSLVAVIALVIGLVVPQFISCIRVIIGLLPDAINKGIALIEEHRLLSEDVLSALKSIDWKSRIEQLMSFVSTGVSGVVTLVINTVTGLISGLVTFFISFIFALYLLASKEKLKMQTRRLFHAILPERICKFLHYVIHNINITFRKYLIGQCTEAVILGLLCGIGMAILQLPYAAMISALIAFTALIPIAGAYIGAGVGAFMILTVSPVKALIFLVFIVVLQQLEGNLIYPRVVGSSMGLPGIWVLAAITIGGGIAGIAGMFLGVPLVAAIYRMVRDGVAHEEAAEREALAKKEAEDSEGAPPAKEEK